MENLNDDLRKILTAEEPFRNLVDFDLNVEDQLGVFGDGEPDFFEEWDIELSQLGINPAILLPGASELQAAYDEQDAPHDVDNGSGFVSPSMIFTQDPSQQLLPTEPVYPLYEQEPFYAEHFFGPYPPIIDQTAGSLIIDPLLENSGSSEYSNHQDIPSPSDANAFVIQEIEEDHDFFDLPPAAPVAPMAPLISSACILSPVLTTDPNENGELVFKASNINLTDTFSSPTIKVKGKGKTLITGGRKQYHPPGRVPFTRKSGNSAGSDLDNGIDLENIAGISKKSFSMTQEFTQPDRHAQGNGTVVHAKNIYIDSDETIDEDDYTLAYLTGVTSVGEYATSVGLPHLEIGESAETPLGSLDGNSSFLQTTVRASSNNTTPAPTAPIKRGRGRPIVPGSKRQRRIQAMAQPDYVPPKRGRPRTSERGQRKRVRRAKTTQPSLTRALPSLTENLAQPVTRSTPEDLNDRGDELSFNQIYQPVILNNEIGYTPDQFILEPAQAKKIQQIYNVELPPGGWDETIDRWRLTFNLNRITPPSSVLYQEVIGPTNKPPIKLGTTGVRDKENVGPDDEYAIRDANEQEAAAELTANIQPLVKELAFQQEVETRNKNVFPNQRLKIIAIDGSHLEMTQAQVLQKLTDERDVYFRAIVWELIQGSQRIGSLEFVGSWNRRSGVWEFV